MENKLGSKITQRINITKDLLKLYQSNYEVRDNNIRRDIDRWSTYPLGLNDRINLIKMNILPSMLYLFLSLPINVSSAQLVKWDRLIHYSCLKTKGERHTKSERIF